MKRLSAFTVMITLAVSMLGTIVIQGMLGCSRAAHDTALTSQVGEDATKASDVGDGLKKLGDDISGHEKTVKAAATQNATTGSIIAKTKQKAEDQKPSAPPAMGNFFKWLAAQMDSAKSSSDLTGKILNAALLENQAFADSQRDLTTDNEALKLGIQRTADKAKQVEDENAKLTAEVEKQKADAKKKDENDIRKSLLWALSICVLLAAGGVFVAIKSDPALGIAMTGAGLAGVGLSLFCIIYAVQIAIVMGVAATIALLAFGYIAYNKFHVDSSSIIKSVQAAIAAGKVKLEDVAGIFDSVQTPAAKKLVDTVTKA